MAFFKSHLPPEVVVRIDWPSLAVLPGSFIKSSLQQVHADLLFSVRMGGRGTLLYLLFEHQSSLDPAMPLRLLGYLMEILTQHHKAHGFPLPPVLPLVSLLRLLRRGGRFFFGAPAAAGPALASSSSRVSSSPS